MLTQGEYERLFGNHAAGLSVKRSDGFIIVSSRVGGACPHWGDGGCLIYPDRPIDCRLYPLVMRHLIERKRQVKIVCHDRSPCPHRGSLSALLTESGVRALVTAFGKEIYGDRVAIVVRREKGALSRLRYRVEAALSRRRGRMGRR